MSDLFGGEVKVPRISKSNFIRSLQCLKSLYLNKKHFKLKDPIPKEKLDNFRRGTDFGILAQGLFPGGIDCSPKNYWQLDSSIRQTTLLMGSGQDTLYEASFNYQNLVCMVDLMYKEGSHWNAYEVKSSSRLYEHQIKDASFQYYILKKLNVALSKFFVVTLNFEVVRENFDVDRGFEITSEALIEKGIPLKSVFSFHDITEEAEAMLDFIETRSDAAKEVLAEADIPNIAMGDHCDKPYTCDFKGFCRREAL